MVDLLAQKKALGVDIDAARAKCASLYDSESFLKLIKDNGPEANDIRLRLRAEIQKRIAMIGLEFGDKHPGERPDDRTILVLVHYVNGVAHMARLGASENPSLLVWADGNQA
jgi:hypothetical protein